MPCDLSTVCIVHTLAQREELNVAVNSKARDAYNHREAKDVKAPLKTLGVDHRADQRDDEGDQEHQKLDPHKEPVSFGARSRVSIEVYALRGDDMRVLGRIQQIR